MTASLLKIKLLKLWEMLRRDTDEAHPLTTNDIVNRLEEMGIHCDRRTVTMDIDMLNECGYEVMSRFVGHNKAYYVADRGFSTSELKILIDAVQAATFITDKKSDELIEKLATLGGSYRADLLTRNLVTFNTRKHTNEQVYYAVLNIETALLKKKKVSFFYYDLDENGERVFRKDKARYIVDPIAMVMHEDNYYLLAYSTKHRAKTTYRIDRMDTVEVEQVDACETALKMRADVDSHVKAAFKMHSGPTSQVTLRFDHSLLGCIYDKFGEDTIIYRIDDSTLCARVPVQISNVFFGWVFQFEGKMTITAPKKVVVSYRELFQSFQFKKNEVDTASND